MVICYIMELFDWIKWKKENCISQWNIRNAHLNHRLKKKFIMYFLGHINCQKLLQDVAAPVLSGLPSSIILTFTVFSRQKEHCVLYSNSFYRTSVAKLIFTEKILLKSMTDVSKAVSCVVQDQSHGWRHKVTKYLNAMSGESQHWENTALECSDVPGTPSCSLNSREAIICNNTECNYITASKRVSQPFLVKQLLIYFNVCLLISLILCWHYQETDIKLFSL